MGMFDELRCKLPLPVPGANALGYQTKDTDRQFLDHYEIREDGTLWREAHDLEDQSDPKAEGLGRIVGMLTRVNKRWVQVTITGEIRFYTMYNLVDGKMVDATSRAGWIEWSAYFENGKLERLNLLENRPPEN